MDKRRWLLASAAALALFAAGYVTGRSGSKDAAVASDGAIPALNLRHGANRLTAPSEGIRTRSDRKSTDEEIAGYKSIVQLVSGGKIVLKGVRIDENTFLPEPTVAKFFALSDERHAEMKQICLRRLRRTQDRVQELAKVLKFSEKGIEFDLPPDPEFAAAESVAFVEELRQAFGQDVSAMLRPSIEDTYRGAKFQRHVAYVLDPLVPPNYLADQSPNISASYEGIYHFSLYVGESADETAVTDKPGMSLSFGGGLVGNVDINDTSPEAYRPPFHDLWERNMGRR